MKAGLLVIFPSSSGPVNRCFAEPRSAREISRSLEGRCDGPAPVEVRGSPAASRLDAV